MTRHPNLNTPTGDHSECQEQANDTPERWANISFVGDVRYCPHGKIQECYQPGGGMIGPGTLEWRDMSHFWDRRRYLRARALLGEWRERGQAGTYRGPHLFDPNDGLPEPHESEWEGAPPAVTTGQQRAAAPVKARPLTARPEAPPKK